MCDSRDAHIDRPRPSLFFSLHGFSEPRLFHVYSSLRTSSTRVQLSFPRSTLRDRPRTRAGFSVFSARSAEGFFFGGFGEGRDSQRWRLEPPYVASFVVLGDFDDDVQGYMENAPEPILKLERELQASKEHVAELKEHLEQVTGALEEAQGQLQQRAENVKVVETAKASVAELAVSE